MCSNLVDFVNLLSLSFLWIWMNFYLRALFIFFVNFVTLQWAISFKFRYNKTPPIVWTQTQPLVRPAARMQATPFVRHPPNAPNSRHNDGTFLLQSQWGNANPHVIFENDMKMPNQTTTQRKLCPKSEPGARRMGPMPTLLNVNIKIALEFMHSFIHSFTCPFPHSFAAKKLTQGPQYRNFHFVFQWILMPLQKAAKCQGNPAGWSCSGPLNSCAGRWLKVAMPGPAMGLSWYFFPFPVFFFLVGFVLQPFPLALRSMGVVIRRLLHLFYATTPTTEHAGKFRHRRWREISKRIL